MNENTDQPLDPESGLTAPEQEIKDVFKTSPENKIWMSGPALSTEEIRERLKAAQAEATITLAEAQKQLQQLKAFQTHGT